MEVLNENSLDQACRMAVTAKRAGKSFIRFEIEAQNAWQRSAQLWEGTIGRVVGRVFAKDYEPRNPDLPPPPAAVERLVIEANVIDVVNAYERRSRREREREGNVRNALALLNVGAFEPPDVSFEVQR